MTMTMDKTQITRRGVLAGLGGMSFALALGADGAKLFSAAEASTGEAKAFNAWVRVAPNGAITIVSPGAEMGQGSLTNLPMIVAEEMDADWSKVSIEMAPADAAVYGYMMNNNQRMMAIVGSRATMLYYADLRTAGAQVRKVMLQNAAERYGKTIEGITPEAQHILMGMPWKGNVRELKNAIENMVVAAATSDWAARHAAPVCRDGTVAAASPNGASGCRLPRSSAT